MKRISWVSLSCLALAALLLPACSPVPAEVLPVPTVVASQAAPTALPPDPTASPSPDPSPTSAPTLTPTVDLLAGRGPTPITVVHPQNGYKGWQVYTNPDYGFSFQYPAEWQLKPGRGTLVGHAVLLVPNTTPLAQMVVAFKRSSEELPIGRTGLGSGELITWGQVVFLGQEVTRQVLVSDGKDMTIRYLDTRHGDLVFDIAVDYLGNWGDPAGLPEDVKASADAIVASFGLD